MDKDYWIHHLRRLAKDNAALWVEVKTLRSEVKHFQDEIKYYQTEFARQNAKLLTLIVQHGRVDSDGEKG